MYHYADDPLLYFTDISISLPQIHTSLYPIIKLSCYKINWGKSLLVPLNIYCYILWFKYNQIIWYVLRLNYEKFKLDISADI